MRFIRAFTSSPFGFTLYHYHLKQSSKGYVDHAIYRDPTDLPVFLRTKADVFKCINTYTLSDGYDASDIQYPLLVIRSYIDLKEDRGDSAKVTEEKLRALELLMPHHVDAFASFRKEKAWPPSPVLPMDWHWIKFTRTSWGPSGDEPWVPDRQARRNAWYEVKDDGGDEDEDYADEDAVDNALSTTSLMSVSS
ncbi:uncharacterized protein LOC62_05G007537 [Vanrija pseudolonga]|uniref:Uncharacterized protein n=1 Tax=Vanrija pseudolonga TaxID=143232 RepID=A0AAF1BN41_9TREE|nr:hypothetical protein LOC62_05G007537 [Vanrija pseudolonga]